VKLAEELGKKDSGNTLYLLDEPTTGLHSADEKKLIDVLHRLVDNDNTVVVIEHELDLVKNADHVVDLGPEGGEHGGELVAEGTPEDLARTDASHTGRYLRDLLPAVDAEGPRGERVEPETRDMEHAQGDEDVEAAPATDD
jgi:excinuclease ABC subunit A